MIWDLMNLYISKEFLLFIILARMKKSQVRSSRAVAEASFRYQRAQQKGNIYIYTRPDCLQMNFDDSWMVSYGSKLRKKEENFDNLCFESSTITVKYHE